MARRGTTTFGNDQNDQNDHDQHDDRHPDTHRFDDIQNISRADHLIEDALAHDAEHRPVYDRVRAHAVAQDISSSGW